MAGKITDLLSIPAIDPANDVLEIVDVSANASYKVTPYGLYGITSGAMSLNDTQTATNKTLTAPTLTSPIITGTVTGTFSLPSTTTFPSSVVQLTGTQSITGAKTFTNVTLTAPTITNASITTDAITGFTTANSGTIYGVQVTASKIVGTSIANSSISPNQLNTTATNASVTTSETTTSTAYTDLATTTDTVTVTIGVNGLALVTLQSFVSNNTANGKAFVSLAGSGANTIAAADTTALELQSFTSNAEAQIGTSFLLTGLTTGVTVFKMKYRVDTGGSGSGTGTFKNRRIGVIPL